jgi:hypothetical protein
MDREDRGAGEEKQDKEYQIVLAKANVSGHRIEGFVPPLFASISSCIQVQNCAGRATIVAFRRMRGK